MVVVTSATLGLLETATRLFEGIPLTAGMLPTPYMLPQTPEPSLGALASTLPHADDVDPSWIDRRPPPLPNRRAIDGRMLTLRKEDGGRTPLESDLYRQWNARFVAELGCKVGALRTLRSPITVFDPIEPNTQPVFRFPPSVTTPLGLVTNRFGWRGPEILLNKPKSTVRVAFVGASTTVGSHDYPSSYPELVGYWLNLWAERAAPSVRFDIINAGREGLGSSSFAAIVRQELLPAEPDLVVYYEGANQFQFPQLIDVPVPAREPLYASPNGAWQRLPAKIRPYSALVHRIDRALLQRKVGDGTEPEKPPYHLTWPADVNEQQPDLASRSLPLQLPVILTDLENIRTSLSGVDAELAVSSFVWLVSDGMRLRPQSDSLIHRSLNKGWWPYRYADMRRMADFQNRVLARYAEAHSLLFIDLAAFVPADPDLFKDAIHFNREGIRVQAWGVLNALVPRIRERLASGAWPRPDRFRASQHRGIHPGRQIPGCAAENR